MFDFASPKPAINNAPVAPAADEDEWAFSSALPDAPPSSNTITVSETSLGIALRAEREPATPTVLKLSITYSNRTDQPITQMEFLAAVSKVLQSGSSRNNHTDLHSRPIR